ncbi:MAG TPA: hypothetical protein VFI02_01085 [Armatimonadota bacterium]|nr:hypothetical protein [Armatimonadota bacterium]
MSEEILSEFTEELAKRKEPVPLDLIEKYKKLGLPESEIAASLLARSALSHPEVPQSAMENSARKIEELSKRSSRPEAKKPGLRDRIKRKLGK